VKLSEIFLITSDDRYRLNVSWESDPLDEQGRNLKIALKDIEFSVTMSETHNQPTTQKVP
jgi:hypothetical protein